MEDILPLVYVLVGSGVAFGGIVYSEQRVSKRQQASDERADRRDTITRLQAAFLEYETAADAVKLMLVERWNSGTEGFRVWDSGHMVGREWQEWARRARLVTTLRSELHDRELANRVFAAQQEMTELLATGPASQSPEDMEAFVDRLYARGQLGEGVAEAIGAAYRKL